jgi:hypothetical protein
LIFFQLQSSVNSRLPRTADNTLLSVNSRLEATAHRKRHTIKLLEELLYHDALPLSTQNISKCFIDPRCKEDEVEAVVAGSRTHNPKGPMSKTTGTFIEHSYSRDRSNLLRYQMHSKMGEETWLRSIGLQTHCEDRKACTVDEKGHCNAI